MPDWLHRLHNSRRARNATIVALGVLTLGSCGGAVFANFVVAGSNIDQYRGSTTWQSASAMPAPPPEWVEEAAVEFSDAGFSPDGAGGYSDARY